MSEVTTARQSTRRMTKKTVGAVAAAFGLMMVAGAAGATYGITTRGGDGGGAVLKCPRGMENHGNLFNEATPLFPGDPETVITIEATIPIDFFQVEQVIAGTHTGTHLDVPGHFITGGRTIDDLSADEFVWPAYVIDVRDRIADGDATFQLSIDDIKDYERENGRIKRGSMVIIHTDLSTVIDGEFQDTPGFSAETVQWMVDKRHIDGIGSDTLGPDSSEDADFGATFTILDNDRVALPGLTNLDVLQAKGDILMAPTVRLEDGSGYITNPISCLGRNH